MSRQPGATSRVRTWLHIAIQYVEKRSGMFLRTGIGSEGYLIGPPTSFPRAGRALR